MIPTVTILLTNTSICLTNWDVTGSVFTAKFAILPMKLSAPVLITTPTPSPLNTLAPLKAMQDACRSVVPRSLPKASLSTAWDSPVIEERSSFIDCVDTSLASAGTLSPILEQYHIPSCQAIHRDTTHDTISHGKCGIRNQLHE